MGAASKVIHVILRVWELICSVIVMGILARFIHVLSEAGAPKDGRIIYALIVACISTLYSMVFMPPFMYAFLAFPADLALFIMWLVAFCLLIARTGIWTCSASWYRNYWGFYWGRWWRRPVPFTGHPGCGSWRSVLGFSFMILIAFLVNAILGAIVVSKYYNKDRKNRRAGTETTQIVNPGQPPRESVASGETGVTGTTAAAPPATHTGQYV